MLGVNRNKYNTHISTWLINALVLNYGPRSNHVIDVKLILRRARNDGTRQRVFRFSSATPTRAAERFRIQIEFVHVVLIFPFREDDGPRLPATRYALQKEKEEKMRNASFFTPNVDVLFRHTRTNSPGRSFFRRALRCTAVPRRICQNGVAAVGDRRRNRKTLCLFFFFLLSISLRTHSSRAPPVQ